jgi:glutamate racemase
MPADKPALANAPATPAVNRDGASNAAIGVFDSGVGGLSVLKALQRELPRAPLIYVADSAHAPYGERSDDFVRARASAIAAHLLALGCRGLVVACNTATAIAVRHLRETLPQIPIVGVEPGIKPAVGTTRNGRIGVMATRGTLASEKFQRLVAEQARGVHVTLQACPGLARLIEDGDLDAPALRDAIESHADALRAADVDTVVLGCTHYTFVHHHVHAAMGAHVRIVDTADAVARHAARTLASCVDETSAPGIRLHTTGQAAHLQAVAAAWLPFAFTVSATPI